MVLAEYAGGVLLVARAGRTSAEELREAALAVGQGGGHMLGVVLTNVSDLGAVVGVPRPPSLMRRVPPSDPSFPECGTCAESRAVTSRMFIQMLLCSRSDVSRWGVCSGVPLE